MTPQGGIHRPQRTYLVILFGPHVAFGDASPTTVEIDGDGTRTFMVQATSPAAAMKRAASRATIAGEKGAVATETMWVLVAPATGFEVRLTKEADPA